MFLSSVGNACRVLRVFSEGDSELGLTELARRVQLSKSQVHHICATLRAQGFLEQDPQTRRYRLGLEMLELGSVVLGRLESHHELRPYINDLIAQVNETVHLGVLSGCEVVFINKYEPPKRTMRMESRIGFRAPAYSTALGKAMLAFASPIQVDIVLQQGMHALTPQTIVDPARFLGELAKIRQQGYATDDRETEPGLCCVAVPIFNARGEVNRALSISAPAGRIEHNLSSFVHHLKATVRQIPNDMAEVYD